MQTSVFTCLILLLVFVIDKCFGQSSGPGIPNAILPCYGNETLYDRSLRIPASISALVALVDRVERVQGINMDMRSLSSTLVHRFRTDGIQRVPLATNTPGVVPFTTSGFQNGRYRLLVEKLLPGNANNFPNTSVIEEEKCSLHFLSSTSVDPIERGDEGTVCNGLQQYRSLPLRPRRRRGLTRQNAEDIEMLSEEEDEYSGRAARQFQNPPSRCPIEEGVIYTPWGAVSSSAVLAGIAAGLQRQQVSIQQMQLTPLSGGTNTGARALAPSGPVDNLYAATFSGDLGEIVLRQSPRTPDGQVQIGGTGGWNDTSMPRHYFLSSNTNYELSAAEVRGGLDGLIIGNSINQLQSTLNRVTLSQIIDMYYSERGIPTKRNLRACQRGDHVAEVAPEQTLNTETRNVIPALQAYLPSFPVSENLTTLYIANAVSRLLSYIPTLRDKSCETNNDPPVPNDRLGTPAVDLTLVIDPNWMYDDAVSTLAAILTQIPPHSSGSALTMYVGSQSDIAFINTTRTILDFYGNFTQDKYRTYSGQTLEVTRALTQLRGAYALKREDEKRLVQAGGRSQMVLFCIQTATGATDQQSSLFMQNEARIFREANPDVRLLFMSSGNKDRFKDLVIDPEKDLFLMPPPGYNGQPDVQDVVKRINELPARFTNPECGSRWEGNADYNGGGQQMEFYSDPLGVTYYRLMPNYFFRSDEVVVRFSGNGQGRVTVCFSRSQEQPKSAGTDPGQSGSTTGDTTCQQITNSESTEFRVQSPCHRISHAIDCKPLHFSTVATETMNRCAARTATQNPVDGCRYPDMVRVTVTANGLGCFSGSSALRFAAPLLVIAALIRYALVA